MAFKTISKFITYTAISLAVLVLACSCALYIGLNSFLEARRPEIETAIENLTAMPIEMTSIETELYPSLHISISGITGFPGESCSAVVSASKASFTVAWRPLLSRKIDATALEIEGLKLLDNRADIERCRQARKTIQQRLENSTASTAAASTPPETKNPAPNADSVDLSIDKIALKQATINLRGATLEIDDLSAALSFRENTATLSNLRGHATTSGAKLTVSEGSIEHASEGLSIRNLQLASDSSRGKTTLSAFISANENTVKASLHDVDIEETLRILNKTIGLSLLTKFAGRASGDHEISWSPKSATRLSTNSFVMNLKVIDRSLTYAADSTVIKATLAIEANNLKGTGQGAVQGFMFTDGTTRVSDTSADLKDIVLTSSNKTGTLVTLTLDGTSCRAEAPNVAVSRVGSLRAPLRIQVPASAGYSVSAPVSLTGVDVTASEFPLIDVSGSVDMLVSDKINRFQTDGLDFTVLGDRGKLRGDLAMNEAYYEFANGSLDLPYGALRATGKVVRPSKGREENFAIDMSTTNVDLERTLKLFPKVQSTELQGTVESAKLTASGIVSRPLETLDGQGAFAISRAGMAGFNFTRALRHALSVLPGVRPPQDDLKVTQRLETVFDIKNQQAEISPLKLQNEHYTFDALGSLSLKGEVKVRGAVVFLRDSASAFGLGIPALERALGRLGKVEVPVHIEGQLPSPSVSVDVKTLMKDNSGITLIGEAVDATGGAVRGIVGTITSLFRSAPSASPTAGALGN